MIPFAHSARLWGRFRSSSDSDSAVSERVLRLQSKVEKIVDRCRANLSEKVISRVTTLILSDPYHLIFRCDLSDCDIDTDSLSALASNVLNEVDTIEDLNLNYNYSLGNVMPFRAISELSGRITMLSLSSCCLDDSAVQVLVQALSAERNVVKHLDLSLNDVTAKGAANLAQLLKLGRIEWLSVDHNRIGNEGCNEIGLALRQDHVSALKQLYIGHNYITETAVPRFLSCLFSNTKLSRLYIEGNFITPRSLEELTWVAEDTPRRNALQPFLALMSGILPRTGKDSLVRFLPSEVLRIVHSMMFSTSESSDSYGVYTF